MTKIYMVWCKHSLILEIERGRTVFVGLEWVRSPPLDRGHVPLSVLPVLVNERYLKNKKKRRFADDVPRTRCDAE